MSAPHLFTYLTREEFKTLFALVFVAQAVDFRGCYPLDDFATPGTEEVPLAQATWEESIRRAGRYLALTYGIEFPSLRFERDGRILAPAEPCQPENMLYVRLFESGQMPSPESALEAAIAKLQNVEGFDLEPLRSALAGVRQSRDLVLSEEIEPEVKAMAEAYMDAALGTVGVVRHKEGVH